MCINMMIGSKGPSDALARSLETLIYPPNMNDESRECSRSTLHT